MLRAYMVSLEQNLSVYCYLIIKKIDINILV